ncbi:MAG: ribose-phosphate pyrophosphokinase [Verrucomicrobiae bacterium]|nr:ribose-phosphate pyrophosphokinase [Verrucomicrobiae bacterium]
MGSSLSILTGRANPDLARKIVDAMGERLADTTVKAFPDAETFVKINENVRGRDVFIIQPTCPPANENLMELLIMMDAAKRASAARITAIIPFYGYARQDRKDQPRVSITAKLVANLLTTAGADRVLTIDLHAQQIQGFFDIPVDHLYSAPIISKYLKDEKIPNLVVVSPDVGGLKMAHAYANLLGAELAIVAKRRVSATETEALYVIGEVEGKNVIIVDDLTETAGTLSGAANFLKKKGALEIRAAVSHAVLNELAIERLQKSPIKELVTTDTVPQAGTPGFNVKILTISGLLAEAIQRIHQNQSVTSLFEINGKSLAH